MKYPQLVSTRAVSAISDWLVTQLEQLGVDASSVYSRLLLSLLHTPLQINALDLAEISDNKVGNFARNKLLISKSGNGVNCRRFSAADTEALKRLAAIDSLLEAVPSDQQLSKIETLIDELSLKLREIEEQNGLDDSEFDIVQSDDNALSNSKVVAIAEKSEASEDPANRYFSAFPALSGQTKTTYSLKPSWPLVNNHKPENPSSSSGAVAIIKKKSKRRRVTNSTMTSTLTNHIDSDLVQPPQQAKSVVTAVKNTNRNTNTGRPNQKKKSSEMWDTNFDGAWEMGRDLIREFVMKQNNRNRSISESEAGSFASQESGVNVMDAAAAVEKNAKVENDMLVLAKDSSIKRYNDMDNDEENLMRVAAAATTALFGKNFDMNMYVLNVPHTETASSSSRFNDSSTFVANNNDKMMNRSEGYATPDTMASWNEIDTTTADQRRECDKMNCNEFGKICTESCCDDNLAAFTAKFNHNVEALWNDSKQRDMNQAASNDVQLNHSFWYNYQGNATAAVAATVADTKQSSQPPKFSNESFKRTFDDNQQSLCSSGNVSGSDKNLFISIQPNSLNSNSSSTTGGMNLTSSIWSDNPNNSEDDISFYSNARLWEMIQSKSQGRKLNYNAIEPAVKLHNKSSTGAASNFDIGNYESSSFSKWSDTEIPFLPIQQDTCMSPQKQNEEKIRKNLFGNSYFSNYQSSQSMNNATNLQAKAHVENNNIEYSASQNQGMKRKVTLVNHSSSSCFKEVEPLSFEAKQELFCKTNANKSQTAPMDAAEPEDLLTSERTRFRPIKHSYADGHTFDISNKLDHISYERSQSGLLYHDSEVYREYYVYDDEGNGGSRSDGDANARAEFTLKYCVRQNDKCCQTDDSLQADQHILSPKLSFSFNENSNRIQPFNSLNNAKNPLSSLQNSRLFLQSNDSNGTQYDDNNCVNTDSIDKLIELSQDSWCQHGENRRRCNNNNSVHALWEHCATCSNDVISMPANSQLKDELSADGDEIMSDLKYLIQSISFRSDWDDSDSTVECNDDCDMSTQPEKPTFMESSRNLLTDVSKMTECDEGFDDGNNDDFTSNHIYSNVNKFISDLLQPEKAKTLVQAISEKCQGRLIPDDKCSTNATDSIMKQMLIQHDTKDMQTTKNEQSCNSSPLDANVNTHFGSLWAYNDNSIWRKELPTETDERHSHDERSVINRFGEQWEHSNLEKIWNCTPSSEDSMQNGTTAMDEQNHHDSAIISTNKNGVWSSSANQNSLTQSKSESNTLEKFMQLFRQQSHSKGQLFNATNSNTHKQHGHIHKNITRYDRKRRHSATSQNCFDHLNYALTNCDTIENIKKLATKTVSECNGTGHMSSCETSNDATTTIITCKYWAACDAFCLDATLAFNNNNNNNNIIGDTEQFFNCYHKQMQQQQQSKYHPDKIMDTFDGSETITMNPTTFLAKQMAAMVSRPLTR